MSKTARAEGYEKVTVCLPANLGAQVKILLADPMRGRVKYGAMAKLITSLLQEWVDKQRKVHNEQRGT